MYANINMIQMFHKGGRAYAVYEANLLCGSAKIGTGKIFVMIVPMSIYKRFMREKNFDYQVQVGNPGPFIFFNAFKCFVNVKTLTLEKYMKHLHLLNVSIHRNFYQNWFINECVRKKAKIL